MPLTPRVSDTMWNTSLSINNFSDGNYSSYNITNTTQLDELDGPAPLNWGVLALTIIIVLTAMGNLLVCLAVCWERRLQNMTNYFLMSLAIADLLVAILVMPLGMVVELYGEYTSLFLRYFIFALIFFRNNHDCTILYNLFFYRL